MNIIVHSATQLDPIVKLDELLGIMEKHQGKTDGYSKELFAWSADVLALAPSIDNASQFFNSLTKKITILFQTILVNPLNPSRVLENPYLDREWVWEKSYLDVYIKQMQSQPLGILSPFDTQPMVPEPYHFAIEIMAWARSIALSQKEENEKITAGTTSKVLMKAEQCIENETLVMVRIMIAQKAIQFVTAKELNRQIAKDTQAKMDLQRQLDEKIKVEAEIARKLADEHGRRISERIDGLERTHTQTVSGFRKDLEQLSRALKEESNRLTGAQVTVQNQQSEIDRLRAQINAQAVQFREATQASQHKSIFRRLFR